MTTSLVGEQTHQAVLPQQPALESVGADTPGSRDETAHGHPATARGTGGTHGRGETGGHGTSARRRHAVTTASAVSEAANGSGDVPTGCDTYAGGIGAARVFVLSKDGKPLMPCHPARARELLDKKRAVVARQAPFVIRLKDRTRAESAVEGVHVRVDPGSKGTGFALTDEKEERSSHERKVVVRRGLVTVELQHRGDRIHRSMQRRAGYRHRRRSANCRYRPRRARNRARAQGWLPPSLRHRVDTTVSLVTRLCRYAPVTEIHLEHVAFDTHSMSAGRALRGAEHRHGSLVGTDARAYLRTKWGSACAYCGATGVPLNIDHLHARSRGGSDRISNLVLACVPCNQTKGSRPVTVFLAHEPERLATILEQVKAPLQDAAAMNTTRAGLLNALTALGRPVRCWSGSLTKQNRTVTGLPKTHSLDALCVGALDREGRNTIVRVPGHLLVVKAVGRGSYARTTPDRFGFPRLRRARSKRHYGFVSGDLAQATVPSGKWAGTWVGHISVRARGQHSLATPVGRINVSHRHLRLLQRGDGYSYARRDGILENPCEKSA